MVEEDISKNVSGAEQDAICGPACADHRGELGTGCTFDDPACPVTQ